MPKRQRPSTNSGNRNNATKRRNNAQKKTKRVKVPNPPKSLINLLQKDKSVLKYFTALQQSLDEDVKEWKNKALEYRQKLKSLQASIEKKEEERRKENDKKEWKEDYEDMIDFDPVIENGVSVGNDDDDDDDQVQKKKNVPPVESIELLHMDSSEDGSDANDSDDSDAELLELRARFQQQKANASLEKKQYPSTSEKTEKQIESSARKIERRNSIDILEDNNDINGNNDDDDHEVKGEDKDKDENKDQYKGLFDDLPSSKGSSSSEEEEEDDDDDDEDDDEDSLLEQFKTKMLQKSSKEKKRDLYKNTLDCLMKANKNLESLGITLIDTYEVEEEKEENTQRQETQHVTNKNELDSDDELLNSDVLINQPLLIEKSRRSDLSVVIHLVQTIRSLIRVPNLEMKRQLGTGDEAEFLMEVFQPFISPDYIPCCYEYDFGQKRSLYFSFSTSSVEDLPQHPLAKGLHLICHTLAILDTYCSSNSPFVHQDEWDALFTNVDGDALIDEEKIEDMKLGMKGRNIASLLLDSLHGEIITWAEIDRSTRSTVTSLKYFKNNDESQSDSDTSDIEIQKTGKNGAATKGDGLVYSFCSKNKNRLFLLLERITHARIVSYLYQHQSDLQNAARIVIEYVLFNTPSPIEEYPQFSPTMSMCVLEALLLPISKSKSTNDSEPTWSPSTLLTPYNSWFGEFLNSNQEPLLANAMSLSIFAAMDIWKQRKESTDRRIREISQVELSAFARLVDSEKKWLHLDYEFDSGAELLENNIEHYLDGRVSNPMSLVLPIQFSLQLYGDVNSAIELMQNLLTSFDPVKQEQEFPLWHLFVPLFKGCTYGIQHFKWESNCLMGLSVERVQSEIVDDERLAFIIDNMIKIYQQLIDYDISNEKRSKWLQNFASTIVQSCLIIGDASRAANAASLVVPQIISKTGQAKGKEFYNDLESILVLAEFPVVRIINLKSRPDRWKNSITQIQRHQLFAVLAVAKLCLLPTECSQEKDEESMHWGAYAYSGKECSHLELEQYISQDLNSTNGRKQKKVADFVATHWRPRDLKAFDRFARDDDTLVRTSVTERACALSHISSWYGVYNTLSKMIPKANDSLSLNSMNGKNIPQLFKISGFARGLPMLAKNHDMLPCPVCIILEDDAMLVDRFNERLESLLSELPRDFHYCSIGFSRPKTAPMVPYSSQIAIPTCLWYCTGYILSLNGAKHLIDCLPVVGPVDSWIGLKMTSNWDNIYGQRIGVGNVTKVTIEKNMLPSRTDLGVIMKFRAFAALTPLCSQKLKWSSSSTSNEQRGAKWRDRDTDITYSGRQ